MSQCARKSIVSSASEKQTKRVQVPSKMAFGATSLVEAGCMIGACEWKGQRKENDKKEKEKEG